MVVKVWDTVSGKKLFGKDPSPFGNGNKEAENVGIVWGLAFSPSGEQIASCGKGVTVWDAATGKQVRQMGGDRMDTISVAYSPDGRYLASGGMGRVVHLLDAASGEAVRTFPGFPNTILKVSFSHDSRRLLAVSDSIARVWELPSGQEVIQFPLASTRTPSVAGGATNPGRVSFSPDGQRLAIAPLGDGTVGVWDTTTGQQILSLVGPGSQVICVAFSPDGHWLAAGGLDGAKGILRVWDARPLQGRTD
jgi:WD40 repeat protein